MSIRDEVWQGTARPVLLQLESLTLSISEVYFYMQIRECETVFLRRQMVRFISEPPRNYLYSINGRITINYFYKMEIIYR